MNNVIDFKTAKAAKEKEKLEFKARQWGHIYSDALQLGFGMDQAMDIADKTTEDMWSEGLGQGNLTVNFQGDEE